MNVETCEALRIDERGAIEWTQLIEISGLSEAELRELVDDGALVPVDIGASSWSFDAHALPPARAAAHALAVVLRFIARIEELEGELRALRAGVARSR
jgi:hypothetical protein